MNIVISGSTGFIGSFVSEKLGSLEGINCVYINKSQENGHLGVLNKEYLRSKLQGCSGILHFAGTSSVGESEKFPLRCWFNNVVGTRLIMEVLQELKISPWFIFPSTREVYGQANKFPVSEASSLNPKNHYGRAKLECESLLQDTVKKVSILRFSSVYGTLNDKPTRVIPSFCRMASRAESIVCNGRYNTLDFIHIQDVYEAIFKTILAMKEGKIFPPLNITSGQGMHLGQLARIINKEFGNRSKIIYNPPQGSQTANFIGCNKEELCKRKNAKI